ncbi:uncharacterized protein PAC_07999 [Phialocephala subalpina]|uniref:Uncharacterized protein n=1 Tax=Phialocephala subalpina TaxID=576137 RepID=A0A1L7WZB0_9HELO|nr:uncharacterized protein PAC_07999 [Phialocephala subalpina]
MDEVQRTCNYQHIQKQKKDNSNLLSQEYHQMSSLFTPKKTTRAPKPPLELRIKSIPTPFFHTKYKTAAEKSTRDASAAYTGLFTKLIKSDSGDVGRFIDNKSQAESGKDHAFHQRRSRDRKDGFRDELKSRGEKPQGYGFSQRKELVKEGVERCLGGEEIDRAPDRD